MNEKLRKRKEELVEKLGVAIEAKDQLAPLAARILSYIILTGKKGSTFEELVCGLGASKSTISTHLNHLLDLKRLRYFTKTGDRKKYFLINSDYHHQNLAEMIETWKYHKQLHEEIKSYKSEVNEFSTGKEQIFDLDFHDNYIEFLDHSIALMASLRTKLIEKQQPN